MIKEDLRPCAKELVGFHKRFAPHFERIECQGHAFHYLRGLLLSPGPQECRADGIAVRRGERHTRAAVSDPWSLERG